MKERLTARFSSVKLSASVDLRTDGDLVRQFRESGDEHAFATLVTRHTPAIRAVCRTWLRHPSDVDDATQATFLVLVQRLESIREPQAVAAWLYRVAEHVARRMCQLSRRFRPLVTDRAMAATVTDETSMALCDEIARLPEKYRRPIQLCYDGGLSTAVAAEQIGCPVNTLVTRLSRAREMLRRRLAQRGIVLSAAMSLAAPPAQGVAMAWVRATSAAAQALWLKESPTLSGISESTISLSQGVARTMIWKNMKLLVAAVMVTTGLIGFVIGQWATADGPRTPKTQVPGNEAPNAVAPKVPAPAKADPEQRRREAVIRLPEGRFVKNVDVAPYGSGMISWHFEDDRVSGLIEGSVMGVDFTIETEAEISLSSNGTIYGLVNSVKVKELKFGGELAEVAVYAKFLPLAEPLINELFTDLPFSYQFRVTEDRLVILSYRALLSGPNPIMKLAPLMGDVEEIVGLVMYVQAFGTAMEGTYGRAPKFEPEPIVRRSYKR